MKRLRDKNAKYLENFFSERIFTLTSEFYRIKEITNKLVPGMSDIVARDLFWNFSHNLGKDSANYFNQFVDGSQQYYLDINTFNDDHSFDGRLHETIFLYGHPSKNAIRFADYLQKELSSFFSGGKNLVQNLNTYSISRKKKIEYLNQQLKTIQAMKDNIVQNEQEKLRGLNTYLQKLKSSKEQLEQILKAQGQSTAHKRYSSAKTAQDTKEANGGAAAAPAAATAADAAPATAPAADADDKIKQAIAWKKLKDEFNKVQGHIKKTESDIIKSQSKIENVVELYQELLVHFNGLNILYKQRKLLQKKISQEEFKLSNEILKGLLIKPDVRSKDTEQFDYLKNVLLTQKIYGTDIINVLSPDILKGLSHQEILKIEEIKLQLQDPVDKKIDEVAEHIQKLMIEFEPKIGFSIGIVEDDGDLYFDVSGDPNVLNNYLLFILKNYAEFNKYAPGWCQMSDSNFSKNDRILFGYYDYNDDTIFKFRHSGLLIDSGDGCAQKSGGQFRKGGGAGVQGGGGAAGGQGGGGGGGGAQKSKQGGRQSEQDSFYIHGMNSPANPPIDLGENPKKIYLIINLTYRQGHWGNKVRALQLRHAKPQQYKNDANFVPFKNEKFVKDSQGINCYHGSTCVEPIMYNWFYTRVGKLPPNFGCFWFGRELNEYCIGANPGNYTAKIFLKYILGYLINKEHRQGRNAQSYENFIKKYANSIKSLMVPCPGCIMNHSQILNNLIEQWNFYDCKTVGKIPKLKPKQVLLQLEHSV